MSAAVLRNKANPNHSHNVPSLIDADTAMGLTANFAVLHALCANHGHVAIRIDDNVGASDLAILELVTHVWKSNGDVGAEVNAALADGRIERHEVDRVRAAVYRVENAMHQMLERLNSMCEPDPRESKGTGNVR
ncbi:hypothetical protein LZ005_19460 [Massilia sp. TS11]|nr:hypothetical protein [Massilia sp. TS11]